MDVHEKGTPQVRIVIIYIWGHECIFFPHNPKTNSCLTFTFSLQFLILCSILQQFLQLWFEKFKSNEAQNTSPAAINSKNKQRSSNPAHHPLNILPLKSIHTITCKHS